MIKYPNKPSQIVARAIKQFDPTAQGFVASLAARPIYVSDKEGTLPSIPRSATMPRLEELRRAPGATFARLNATTDGDTYACVDYGAESQIPLESAAENADIFDADMLGAEICYGELMAGREKRVADLLFDASTWTGASLFADNSDDAWSSSSADILGQVGYAVEKVRSNSGMLPDTVIMSHKNYQYCTKTNDAILGKFSGIVVPTPDAVQNYLAALLGVQKVIVGNAVYNSGNENDTSITVSNIWSDSYVMVAKTANTEQVQEPTVARTVVWEAMGRGTAGSPKMYFEDQTNSRVVQLSMHEDEVVRDSALGFLMQVA